MRDGAAIAALVERDLRAFTRSRSQFYSSVFTPLLFVVFLGVGVSRGLEPSTLSDGDFTAYLLAGAAAMTAVFSATFSAAAYYRDRDSGLLRVLLASPRPPRVILAGRSVSGAVIGAGQSFIVLALAAPFVDLAFQHGVAVGFFLAAVMALLLNLIIAGLASALSTRVETMQGFHLLMNLALFPLLFFSGAFFPLEGLPAWFRIVAYANPMTYAVDGLHQALYASSSDGYIGLWVDLAVLVAFAAFSLAGGLARAPRLTWSGR